MLPFHSVKEGLWLSGSGCSQQHHAKHLKSQSCMSTALVMTGFEDSWWVEEGRTA